MLRLKRRRLTRVDNAKGLTYNKTSGIFNMESDGNKSEIDKLIDVLLVDIFDFFQTKYFCTCLFLMVLKNDCVAEFVSQ